MSQIESTVSELLRFQVLTLLCKLSDQIADRDNTYRGFSVTIHKYYILEKRPGIVPRHNPLLVPSVQCVLHNVMLAQTTNSLGGLASLNIVIRKNIFRELPKTNNPQNFLPRNKPAMQCYTEILNVHVLVLEISDFDANIDA